MEPSSSCFSRHSQEPVWQWFPGDDLFTLLERRRGLPIGNQTSQFFANVYLDPLDHFLKDRLCIPGYVRYVDDLLAFSNDKKHLAEIRSRIVTFLEQLRLKLHPDKSVIFPTIEGVRFLGYRVFPSHRLLAKENVKRFRHRMRCMQEEYAAERITVANLSQRVASWIGHAGHADTYRLRTRLFREFGFRRPHNPQG